jgi:hypothetical protein
MLVNLLIKVCTVAKITTVTTEGKGIPLQAWTGPEGSRRLRLSGFKITGI